MRVCPKGVCVKRRFFFSLQGLFFSYTCSSRGFPVVPLFFGLRAFSALAGAEFCTYTKLDSSIACVVYSLASSRAHHVHVPRTKRQLLFFSLFLPSVDGRRRPVQTCV